MFVGDLAGALAEGLVGLDPRELFVGEAVH